MKKKKRRRLRLFLSVVFLPLILASAAYLLHLDEEVVKKFEGQRWKLPSKIYSAPFLVQKGLNINKARLLKRLKRLAYRPATHPVSKPGEYFKAQNRLEIFLHAFTYPDAMEKGRPYRVLLSEHGEIEQIVEISRVVEQEPFPEDPASDPTFLVEPEMIGGFYESSWEERRLIRLSELPQTLIDAVLVMEDRRFFEHPGINLKSIARAAWVNLWAGKIVQGGSTLTQQLVKNFFLDSERSFQRKAVEAAMALLLERRYSKEEILEVYFNEIYFGQNRAMGIYGVGQAAWFYFEKQPADLSLGEAALLAGIIRSPNLYSPVKDLHRAVRRRNLVLDILLKEGKITRQAFLEARREKVSAKGLKQRLNRAPYFVDQVRRQMAKRYPPRILNSGGLQIFTTLDVELQAQAERALQEGLGQLEARDSRLKRSDPQDQLQGALVALEPESGAVRAMVGGRDYQVSQFNRVTDARRQPGSLFKPIVYLTAFEEAANGGNPYSPISEVDDAPLTLQVGGKPWSPRNYDKQYLGPVSLRAALERSRNTATVRLSQELGIESVVSMARDVGIKSPLKPVPSLALGSIEVSPLEMGVVYSTLAHGGVYQPARFVTGVIDPSGLPLDFEPSKNDPKRVVSPEAAFLVTHLLKGVIEHGTGRGVRKRGFDAPAAGKTGTTSRLRDAWFVGYTPDLAALVWVGFDQDQRGNLSGSSAALPIWTDFMEASALYPPRDFSPPPRIVFKKVNEKGLICDEDGLEEAFIEGTEPQESCEKGLLKWIKRFF